MSLFIIVAAFYFGGPLVGLLAMALVGGHACRARRLGDNENA